MKIVAVIVTYNGMRWYKNCFDSLRNSTVPIETVVIDNKSTDNTIQYIKENYPEIHLIESNTNLGFGKANNVGMKYAIEQDADFVLLLNQDAWVKPDTIERLASKMTETSEYGILSPIHLNGAEDRLDFYFDYYILADRCPGLVSDFVVNGKAQDKIYPIKFVNAALWLISKECLDTVGGFAPVFPHYGEDENYISRVEYHNYKLGVYPLVFGIHDRPQQERAQQTFSQKKKKAIISYLVILTNIHHSLISCVRRSFVDLIFASFRDLFRLSFKDLWINFLTFINIIRLLYPVYKNRNISKNKAPNFL